MAEGGAESFGETSCLVLSLVLGMVLPKPGKVLAFAKEMPQEVPG